jgi:DNA-directed RNA polymerase I subunit RPA2
MKNKMYRLFYNCFFTGFICPVHTPDGAPCGLLNHLTAFCRIVTETQDTSKILDTLVEFGMSPIEQTFHRIPVKECYTVTLDGRVLGYIPQEDAKKTVDQLRLLKIKNEKVIDFTI